MKKIVNNYVNGSGNSLIIDDEDKYEKLFLQGCVGIALYKRGPDDNHVCFKYLCEDDGHWFEAKNGWSTSWFSDMVFMHSCVSAWLQVNCIKGKYGYSFKC